MGAHPFWQTGRRLAGDRPGGAGAAGQPDARAVLASFDGSGSPQLESFAAAADYALVVASDGGPIKVTVDDGSGERSIYDRPESSGISTYETSALGTGNISVAVEAAEQVGWRIVAITLP